MNPLYDTSPLLARKATITDVNCNLRSFKYFIIGLIVIVFSPVVVPVYACWAVGKIVSERWLKM